MVKIIPQIEEIKTLLSAWEIFELLKDEPHSFFLDSSSANTSVLNMTLNDAQKTDNYKFNRYSFIGSKPFLIFRSKGTKIELIRQSSQGAQRAIEKLEGNPLEILDLLLKQYRIKSSAKFSPFQCGAVGYFGYELYPFIERKIPLKVIDDLNIPDCYLGFYDPIIIFDHLINKVFICKCGFAKDATKKINQLKKTLSQKPIKPAISKKRLISSNLSLNIENLKDFGLISNFSKDDYIKAIIKIKDYITNGDVYQVNLSQRLTTDFNLSAFELYEYLRQINPASFSGFLNFDSLKILSSSPERFLKIQDGIIETRPIKGTRPRGNSHIQDKILKTQLLKSKKDRAEHIMIVDLERNDLGRICEYGSIMAKDLSILETYSTVFHLVSTIAGKLSKGKGPVDCLRACFPGGSITGAPKIRSMEIINELEPTRRDIYTGSIGYISFNGNLDLSIVIRSLIVKNAKVYLYAGGGIVADSDPQEEYDETINKAKALILALNNRKVLNR